MTLSSVRLRLIAAVAAGAISIAGFGDWPAFFLPLAAFTGLVWLWLHATTAREAAWLGFAFGGALFLGGVSWVYVSLHDFGMMPAPLAAIATVAFCAILASYAAAAGYAQARIGGAPTVRALVLIPTLWTLGEWLRSWIFTGFPWLALGYSQLDAPLAGYAPIAGGYGVSFLTAVVAGCIVLAVRRERSAKLAIGLIVIVTAGGATLAKITWTTPYGDPITVALLQGNIPQSLKFVPGRYASTLATYARLAESTDARLVVMPETAIPRLLEAVDPEYLERLSRRAAARRGDVIVGVPMRDTHGRYYNAVVSIGASPRQTYAKDHLVPFGEFIPPGFGWILAFLKIPLSDFTAGGADQKPLAVAGQRVAVNICYEDSFGEEIIRQLPEATLLVNVSNVAWFGDSLAPAQHLRISRMRAIEAERPMLRATNTGVTAIVDERGNVVARLPSFTEGVLSGTVQGRTGATPYVLLGNYPVVLLSLVCIGAGIWAARRRRL